MRPSENETVLVLNFLKGKIASESRTEKWRRRKAQKTSYQFSRYLFLFLELTKRTESRKGKMHLQILCCFLSVAAPKGNEWSLTAEFACTHNTTTALSTPTTLRQSTSTTL